MRPFSDIFRRNDAVILAVILVLSITAGRLPDFLNPDYPYPTTLYSIFGTICQSLGPILAAALFFLLYSRSNFRSKEQKENGENPHLRELLKGVLLLACTLLLALALMPFADLIYNAGGVRQGVALGVTLLSLWSVMQTVLSGIRVMSFEK